ncbi:ABC transporter ATP-binding protein [Pseudonocardia lacus]|uniref:ABC transporter ATP-binding protein n=1 Tax=Pseudonocardia lacus TaxID=2835865 RepID=UPI0027E2AB5F|nr:ABC transporter ATP-binding protein [Pseudonocardia lacus]
MSERASEPPGTVSAAAEPDPERLLRPALALAREVAAPLLAVRLAVGLVAALVPAGVAWLTKVVLDRLVDGGELALPVAGLALGGVAVAALPQLVEYLDAELRRAFALATRQRLYSAVGRLRGLARHEDPDFQTRLSLATEVGPTGPAEVLTSSIAVVQGAVMAAGFLSALAVVNPWMLVVVLAAAAPSLRAELALSRHRAAMITQLGHAARREHFYAQLIASVEAAKEVRLYGLDGLFAARMVTELRRVDAGYRAADRRELRAQALLGGLGALVAGGGLAWAVAAASRGELSVGDVSVFAAAVAGVQGGLGVAISAWAQAHHALLLFGHYQHIVRAEPDLPVRGDGCAVPVLGSGIEFRDVWFRYADDLPWILRGASFTLRAGAATALVGSNGAGKSTLVKLLCRFYDPTAGAILWDGVDLRELDLDELRSRIGAVFQDFMHYELSAAENIAVGDVAALDDRERVARAAAWAGVAPAVEALPRSYDTMLTRIYMSADVGDDPVTGVVLSGGQWQRLALARAVFRRDAAVVVLDEPSSGLDAAAEHEVHERLRELRTGRTSLLISHRLSTVRDADLIVVLADGAVAESGAHDELMALGGRYATLFRLQASGYA